MLYAVGHVPHKCLLTSIFNSVEVSKLISRAYAGAFYYWTHSLFSYLIMASFLFHVGPGGMKMSYQNNF